MAAQGLKVLAPGLAALLALSAAAAADPLDPPVAGPGRLCFKYGSFLLVAGEHAVDFQGGPETMTILIDGPSGRYRIAEGEIFLGASDPGEPLDRQERSRTYRSARSEVQYNIYGRVPELGPDWKMLAFIDGKALTGGASDAAIHRRYRVGATDLSQCIHGFGYGWEYLFPSQ